MSLIMYQVISHVFLLLYMVFLLIFFYPSYCNAYTSRAEKEKLIRKVFVDPMLFIAEKKMKTGENILIRSEGIPKTPRRIFVVKARKFDNLQILSGFDELLLNLTKFFLTYSFVELTKKVLNCISYFHSPGEEEAQACLDLMGEDPENLDFVYLRYPRKLFPLRKPVLEAHGRISTKVLRSVEEIEADTAREIYRVSGKGVVVGIVDTGIRWDSSLLTSKIKDDVSDEAGDDGFSKSMFIWDQNISPADISPFKYSLTFPKGFSYGVECAFPSARYFLEGYSGCPSRDDIGHGTHIAGIVALEGVGIEGEKIRGVAPDAVLITVATTLYEPDVVDAVRYIFAKADEMGLPAVVNISLGGHFGPHDGTSLFEVLLRNELGKGKIIVSAGGNEANLPVHVGGEYSGTISFVVRVDDECEVQIWLPKNSGAELEVSFKGKREKVKKGERKFILKDANNNNLALIDFSGGADIPLFIYSNSDVKEGVVFASSGFSGEKAIFLLSLPERTRFDAWVSSDPKSCSFTNEGDVKPSPEGTIAVPGTSPDIVAVGSYVITGQRKGNISRFSSWGFDSSKPNITAPGEVIYSVCPTEDDRLCPDRGTSQASPHVSGAIALALERNPLISPEDIISALCKGAIRDNFTGDVPNKIWGCGKLNVPGFLSNVPPLSRRPKERRVSYVVQEVKLAQQIYRKIYLSSDLPFRVFGDGFYDTGWSQYHILFMRELPSSIKAEFLDGFETTVQINERQGIGCGCSSYHYRCSADSRSYLLNLSFILLGLIIFVSIRSLFVSRT